MPIGVVAIKFPDGCANESTKEFFSAILIEYCMNRYKSN